MVVAAPRPDVSTDPAAGTVHVIGAGLAGLAAAVALTRRDRRVIVHEGARQAGGRCRSYYDASLDMMIDNGNHLLLSGNDAAMAFLRTVGGADTMRGAALRRLSLRRPRDRRTLDRAAEWRCAAVVDPIEGASRAGYPS